MAKKNRPDWGPPGGEPLAPTKGQARNRKIVKWFFLLSVGLLIVVILAPSSDSDKMPSNVVLSPVGKLEQVILKETGSKSNLKETSGARMRSFTFSGGRVVIEMNGDENLSSGLTKSANRRLVLKAIKGLQKSAVTFDSAVIAVYYPLVDNLGNTSVDQVLKYSFSAARVVAINTDNVDTHGMDVGFADIATIVHPAFAW